MSGALALLTSATLGFVMVCLSYLFVLALASIRSHDRGSTTTAGHRFAVVVAACDEEGTIGATLRRLTQQSYPSELYRVVVVADNCGDETASEARAAGASTLERVDLLNRSKGHALAWALPQVLAQLPAVDAVVVFDADSNVDERFLAVADSMLRAGFRVVQGKHVIANPQESWFASMMFSSFALDNRLRNQGRSNLGLSPKLMGDAMCFHRSVLEALPWQAVGETEDAEYWATLVLAGEPIVFAPQAVAYGGMVSHLRDASRQRTRWIRGRAAVAKRFTLPLVRAGLRRRQWRLLDAAIELTMPSLPTLSLLLGLATLGMWLGGVEQLGIAVAMTWAALLAYPLLGLWLERAPWHVYAMLAGAPVYLVWRSVLRLALRFRGGSVAWVRTPRSFRSGPGRDRKGEG